MNLFVGRALSSSVKIAFWGGFAGCGHASRRREKVDEIQGPIEAGAQLPPSSRSGGEEPFGDGRRYQYIEGDVSFFFQGDGHFYLEAHPVDGSPKSGLKLLVDSDEWWSEVSREE